MKPHQVLLLCSLVLAMSATQAAGKRRHKRSPKLDFTAHPPVVVPGHSKELTLNCEVRKSPSDVMAIYILLQRTNENGTVNVALQMTETKLMAVDNRTTVEGNLNGKDGGKSFLKVVIADPVAEDEGEYACQYLFLNPELNTLAASANVTSQELPPGEVYVPPPPLPSNDCCKDNRDEIERLKAMMAGGASAGAVSPGDATCNVAFSVQLKEETGYRLRSNQIILFNTIVSNRGAAYDTSTGKFTAPCTGQYFFSLTLTAEHSTSGSVEGIIRREEKNQVRSYSYSSLGYDEVASGSTSVVLTLQKGDVVDVLLMASSEGEYVGGTNSVFSGYFLFP